MRRTERADLSVLTCYDPALILFFCDCSDYTLGVERVCPRRSQSPLMCLVAKSCPHVSRKSCQRWCFVVRMRSCVSASGASVCCRAPSARIEAASVKSFLLCQGCRMKSASLYFSQLARLLDPINKPCMQGSAGPQPEAEATNTPSATSGAPDERIL